MTTEQPTPEQIAAARGLLIEMGFDPDYVASGQPQEIEVAASFLALHVTAAVKEQRERDAALADSMKFATPEGIAKAIRSQEGAE